MFERLERSWSLVKASAAVLRENKSLMVLPVLSSICSLIVTASFLIPAFVSGAFDHIGSARHMTPAQFVTLFAFYVSQYFVIIFFNSALIGAALMHLRGERATLGDGLRLAASRLPSILGYAVVSATVGMVLRAIEERAGFVGRIVTGLLGAAWTLATFMVVPILVSQDVGPIDAVQRSVQLLKRTWGESLIGNAGIGMAFSLVFLLVIMLAFGLLMLAANTGSRIATVSVVALGVAAVLLLSIVQAALHGIYAAAVYRYAEEGDAGAGFERTLLANAFRLKA